MNQSTKILPILALLLCLGFHTQQLQAQRYVTAAGVRIGNNHFGFSLQQRIAKKMTVEGILQSNYSFTTSSLIGLVERHHGFRRLNFYYGLGPRRNWSYDEEGSRTSWALDGVVGIEATFLGLNASLDFKPTIVDFSEKTFMQPQGAVSIRYVFISDKQFRKKRRKRRRKKHGFFR